jgi:adenylate kinase
MNNKTLIFIGPSGSGKGTQVEKVKAYLKEKDANTPIAHLVMGDLFRTMFKGNRYSDIISRDINLEGGLQPGFLQVVLWSQFLVDNIHGNEHVIIDGSPRRLIDAQLMETAFDFYRKEKPTLVFINCDLAIVKDRIIARANRPEDKDEKVVDARLAWYTEFVVPAIDYFRNKEKFGFVEIDGSRTREEVFAEIKAKVFNDNH